MIFFGRKFECKHFDKKTKKCLVFNTDKLPTRCKIYPFDEKDKWTEFKDNCGFYWEKENK